jgi:hypothetical protein
MRLRKIGSTTQLLRGGCGAFATYAMFQQGWWLSSACLVGAWSIFALEVLFGFKSDNDNNSSTLREILVDFAEWSTFAIPASVGIYLFVKQEEVLLGVFAIMATVGMLAAPWLARWVGKPRPSYRKVVFFSCLSVSEAAYLGVLLAAALTS